ncbi:MAG: nicotinate-nucleotide adenylyltransferase [Eubacteriaceae bacterium]|nr:nicotinate-nucleotide adenylyltransferase [Eubacteriaceae bacterium]
MREIGILGGSFDPIHYGHISIAEAAMDECGLSSVILMPTRIQPFKIGKKVAGEEDRVNMVRLVAEEHEGFVVSTMEAFLNEVSYTYKTFKLLQNQYENSQLNFIIGTDSLLSLENWYRGKDLLKEASFIVAVRPGYREDETLLTAEFFRNKYGARIRILNNKPIDISSTNIRNHIKNGKDISSLVPSCVEEYIYEHGLYK